MIGRIKQCEPTISNPAQDPCNPNGYNAYRELSRFALQKENLTAAARHLINAVNLCPDAALKKKLHREARMISAAVNLYNRPESELERAGKLIQEAGIAPPTSVSPILLQACRILSAPFVEKYQIQKKLLPINPAFMTTYQSSLEPIPSTLQDRVPNFCCATYALANYNATVSITLQCNAP